MSRRILAATLAALAFCAAPLQAQLIAYDGFGNGPKNELNGSTGGTGWSTAWQSTGTDKTKIAGAGLSWSGMLTAPGAAVTPVASGVWPSSSYTRTFQAPPSGTTALYVSFLVRDDAGSGIWGGLQFGQYPHGMTVGSPLGYYTYGMMSSDGIVVLSSKPLVTGETTLVVVKIAQNAAPGAGFSARMYLDPMVGTSEPSYADATFGVSPLAAMPASLSIDNGTGFTTDEIRVGTTWESVLPAAPSPWTDLGFAKPGVNGAPHLGGTGSLASGTAASITLSSARPNAATVLFAGTSVVDLAMLGGVLVPSPTLALPLATDAHGAAVISGTWPSGMAAGTGIVLQFWIDDPAATFGVAASNGLKGVTP